MKAAGYRDADGDGKLDGFPRLRLLYNTDESHRALADSIAKQLGQHLGMLIPNSNRAGRWIGDYLDPTTFLHMLRTGEETNVTGWSHATYDELLSLADDPVALAKKLTKTPSAAPADGVAALRALRTQLLREAEAIVNLVNEVFAFALSPRRDAIWIVPW